MDMTYGRSGARGRGGEASELLSFRRGLGTLAILFDALLLSTLFSPRSHSCVWDGGAEPTEAKNERVAPKLLRVDCLNLRLSLESEIGRAERERRGWPLSSGRLPISPKPS